MFGTIRRHQTWLWAVIVTLTVISFVYFFNPNAKYSGRGGTGKFDKGSVDGEVVTRDAYLAAAVESELSYFLNHGNWPDRDPDAKRFGYNEEREVYERLFLTKKARDLGIHVGHDEIARTVAQILVAFQGRGSRPPTLEEFSKSILESRGLTTGDLQRYLQNSLSIRSLVAAVGQGGRLATPQEAELLFRREHEEISSEAVFFSASNYLSQVTVSPAELGTFFTNQMPLYRVSDRVQVSYIKFPAADFFNDADLSIAHNTNFETQVEAIYLQRGTNYYKDTTPAAAKLEIRKEARQKLALQAARKPAAAFADMLLDQSPARAGSFAALAAKSNFTASVTAPFDAETGPAELNVPPEFTRYAFKLTSEEPFAGPIVGEDAVYVIALKNKIPSEIPAFDSIRAKVAADFQLFQATQLARQAGTNFAAAVGAGLAQGKTFAALAADSKLSVAKLPAFSLSTRALPEVEGHIAFGRLQEIAYGIPTGYSSGFATTTEGGLVLHIVSRASVSDQQLKAELPAFLTQIRSTRQNEAFQAWFSREAQTGLRDTPLAKQQQAK